MAGRKPKDITGQRFGRLVAIKNTNEKHKRGSFLWLCKCDCGNECVKALVNLNRGNVKSCGCLAIQQKKENGMKCGSELGRMYGANNIKKANAANGEKNEKEGTLLSQIKDGRRINGNNTSGNIGVTWDKSRDMWIAHLKFKGKSVLHKRFASKQDAINARKEAEDEYFKPILEKYGKTKG